MTEAIRCTVNQAAVDWYVARYPADGADDIERWKAAGEIVIIDERRSKGMPCEDFNRILIGFVLGVVCATPVAVWIVTKIVR